MSLSISIWAPSSRLTSTRGSSSGTRPESTFTASWTSKALPTARPSGWFISVMMASHRRPRCAPMRTMREASFFASSTVCMNAPEPTFTSSTMASAPAASFLLMTLEAMRGVLPMVAVTSRRA